jgi:hypothetical protein
MSLEQPSQTEIKIQVTSVSKKDQNLWLIPDSGRSVRDYEA